MSEIITRVAESEGWVESVGVGHQKYNDHVESPVEVEPIATGKEISWCADWFGFFRLLLLVFFCLWYLFILEGGLDPNLDYIIFLLWMNLMWWLLNERKTSQPSSLK
ncbi:hypothetical protein P8452_18537 [Trifolium repens]|nr:hypothetical protein P8452_18537 [Trifolium repens]